MQGKAITRNYSPVSDFNSLLHSKIKQIIYEHLEKGKIEDSTYILRSQPKRDHYWVCLNSIGESNHATMPGSKRVRKMKKLLPRDNPTRCKGDQSTYFSRVTGYPCHSIILSFCHYSLTRGELLFKWIYVVQSLNVLTSTFQSPSQDHCVNQHRVACSESSHCQVPIG